MIKASDDVIKRIQAYAKRRKIRLDARKDGGPGSGNWNHVGRLHKRGGSAPAGTLGNFGERAKGKYYKVGTKTAKGHYVPDLKSVIGQTNSTTGNIQNNTATMWTNQNGDVHEKRMAIYEDALDETFRGKKPPQEGKKKVFTVIGGAAGSGKRNLQDSLPGLRNSVSLGANRMAQMIGNAQDRYEGGNTSKAQARSKASSHFSREGNQMHEEASALSKAALREAFDGGYNITYDTAASSIESTRAKLEEARKNGYELRGEFINAPLQQCLDREKQRWEAAKRNYMRNGKLASAYPPEMPNFETMVQDYAFSVDSTVLTASLYDTFNLYDNSSTGGKFSDMRVKMAELAVDDSGQKCLKLTDEKYRDKLQHFLDQGNGAYTIDKDGYVRVVRTPEEQAKDPVQKGQQDIVSIPGYPRPIPNPDAPKKPRTPKTPKAPTEPEEPQTPEEPSSGDTDYKNIPKDAQLTSCREVPKRHLAALDEGIEKVPEASVKEALRSSMNASVGERARGRQNSHYSRLDRKLHFKPGDLDEDYEMTGEVVSHEAAHWLDWNFDGERTTPFSAEYNGGEFASTLSSEITDFLKSCGYNPNISGELQASVKSAVKNKIADVLGLGSGANIAKTDYASFSDMIDSVTNQNLRLGFGHPFGYWTEDSGRNSSEPFAELMAAYATNPRAKQAFQKLIPKTCSVFEQMCEHMIVKK